MKKLCMLFIGIVGCVSFQNFGIAIKNDTGHRIKYSFGYGRKKEEGFLIPQKTKIWDEQKYLGEDVRIKLTYAAKNAEGNLPDFDAIELLEVDMPAHELVNIEEVSVYYDKNGNVDFSQKSKPLAEDEQEILRALNLPTDKTPTPYEILGVAKNATKEEIKSAYNKLSRKWHPDKNISNEKFAAEVFKYIETAYSTIK